MNTKRLFQFFVIIMLTFMNLSSGSANAQSSQVLYAEPGGLTSGSCASWATACELQYALTSAVSGQEIWVAAGVYKPGTARTDTFQLKSGVGVYGGFVGTESSREERDWKTNKTVLSGDIDNNDINNDGNFVAETIADIQGENAYHVVTSSGTDSTATLDGFVITAGWAYSDPDYLRNRGGGIYNEYGSPTLTNIIFSANSAYVGGGGMYNAYGRPTLTNITFSFNTTEMGGGGIENNEGSPILTNVTFTSNSAWAGGGMHNAYGNPMLTNATFFANSVSYHGGGMYNGGGNTTLTNVIFSSNLAGDFGGGMMNSREGTATLMNVTFSSNSATYVGGGLFNDQSSVTLVNNILWGNTAPDGPEIWSYLAAPNIIYSDVQGSWPGTGNIDADPMFVDAANGDLHLQAGSPAIDSGTYNNCPTDDFDGVVRPQDGNNDGTAICDMGAFEYYQPIIHITIDIKPGSYPNPINLGSKGVVPVAVLTTADFNAGDLDPATVIFAGASPSRWAQKDVDRDGDMDLLFHFKTRSLKLDKSSTEAALIGKTFEGVPVEASDSVKIVPRG